MKLSKTILSSLAIAMSVSLTTPAFSQGIPVNDAAAIATARENILKEIAEMAKQLEEAKRLYDSVNGMTEMADIAEVLNNPEVRELLGPEFMSVASSFSGDLDSIGALKEEAQKMVDYANVSGADVSAIDYYEQEMDRITNMTARDGAAGEHIMSQADARLSGLERLREALGTATTQKEVDALQARINLEMAMLQNDTNRIEGLAMLQNAQDEINTIRAREAAIEKSQQDHDFAQGLYGDASE